jgi:hypothetical protein
MSLTPRLWPLAALACACLALTGDARAQTPSQIGRDPIGVLHTLETATDARSVAVRRQIEAGPADLARARAEIEKDGVSLDPAALQRPLPPPDQNAAPLYQKLFQLLRDKPLGLPIYAQPLTADHTYTPEQLAVVQKIYDSRPDVWGLVHQAADRPQCVYTRHWSEGFSVLFPEFQQFREAARLLNTETYLLAAQGRYAEAVQNQTRGFRVAEHAASDPVLISYLVGNACEAITLNGMRGLLDRTGPNAAVDAQVRAAIETSRPRLSLRYALAGEVGVQATGLQQMQDALDKEGVRGVAEIFVGKGDPLLKRLPPGTPADRRFAQDWLDESEAIILTRMRSLLAAADLTPVPRRQAFAQEAQVAAPDSVLTLLSNMVLPVFAQVDSNETRRVALEEVTVAAAVVLASRAKTGAFPDALPEPFADPYTSKPLGYRREGADSFVVYSAGPDGKYDGGKPGEKMASGQVGFRYPVLKTPAPVEGAR